MPRSVCAVTGSRADYGLLRPVLTLMRDDAELALHVVVTGAHLAPEFGSTWRVLVDDGFAIEACVDLLLSDDSAAAVSRSLGLAVIGFGDVFDRLRPDFLMVLGDRYEIMAATLAATVARIPIVHLCGGDVTEGAFDEGLRHAISKLSHIHCVTNAEAARRVRQLGEDPARVVETGSPGLDAVRDFHPLPRAEFFARIGLRPHARNLLVTYHPVTLEPEGQTRQLAELLAALDDLGPDIGLILTGSNADPDGLALTQSMRGFAERHANACFHLSLGQTLYFNALTHADAIVGNSSSGLYEAPSFHTATVNIGDRQKGRPRAASVLDCPPQRRAIAAAIDRALCLDCTDVTNPYGDGHSAEHIVAAVKAAPPPEALLKKRFFDMAGA